VSTKPDTSTPPSEPPKYLTSLAITGYNTITTIGMTKACAVTAVSPGALGENPTWLKQVVDETNQIKRG